VRYDLEVVRPAFPVPLVVNAVAPPSHGLSAIGAVQIRTQCCAMATAIVIDGTHEIRQGIAVLIARDDILGLDAQRLVLLLNIGDTLLICHRASVGLQ
jgi:hypothetical protein